MNSETPDPKITELKPFAEKLIARFAERVLNDAPQNAGLLAELAQRMTHYAVQGDQRGMDAVAGRMAGLALQVKLETESAAVEVLKMVGDALMDAASHFLPRVIANLTDDES